MNKGKKNEKNISRSGAGALLCFIHTSAAAFLVMRDARLACTRADWLMSLQKWLDGRASKRDPSAARQTIKAMKSQSTEPATRDGDGYLAAGRSCTMLRNNE